MASKADALVTVPAAADMTLQTLRMHIQARHPDMRGFRGRTEHAVQHLLEKDAGTETHVHVEQGEQGEQKIGK